MAQPKYRLSISNRDKSERTFKDYKGQERTSKYQSIGAVFANEDGRLSIAIDKAFKFDPATMWMNLYVVEQEDDEDEAPKSKKSKGKPASKVKKTTKKAPPPSDDEDDESDPFSDDEE